MRAGIDAVAEVKLVSAGLRPAIPSADSTWEICVEERARSIGLVIKTEHGAELFELDHIKWFSKGVRAKFFTRLVLDLGEQSTV